MKIKVGECKHCGQKTKQVVVERVTMMNDIPFPLRGLMSIMTLGVSEMTDEWRCECTICRTINTISNI